MKIPKNENDIEEIEREISQKTHHEHEPTIEDLLADIYSRVQNLTSESADIKRKTYNLERNISIIYGILAEILLLFNSKSDDEKKIHLNNIHNLLNDRNE